MVTTKLNNDQKGRTMIKRILKNYLTIFSRRKKFSIIKNIPVNSSPMILDIACGTGEFLEKLIYEDQESKIKMNSIIALDFRKSHLMDIKEKYGIDKLVVADACALPFKDNSIDLIVSNAFLEHLPIQRRKSFALEVNRVGMSHWIAVPDRFSFIEVHYNLPCIGWLTPGLRDKIVAKILRRELHYDPINLMTKNELENLFPDYSECYKLNILGLVSHLIVIKFRKRNAT